MAGSTSASNQILVEEIRSFTEALRERGAPQVGHMLREYVLRKMGALMVADDQPVDLAGTESFLNRVNYFVTRDAAPRETRQPLLAFLLDVDAQAKVLDLYHEHRQRAKVELPGVDSLERELRRHVLGRLDSLYEKDRQGSVSAGDELVALFTETSFELAKYLFEEAERRFAQPGGKDKRLLPEIVARLEARMFAPTIAAREAQAILDRLSYLFARLSIDALRKVDDDARRLKDERGIAVTLQPFQVESISESLKFLKEALPDVQRAPTIQGYLRRINEKKATISQWDKKLMVHIDLRLGLKQYHNAITDDLLRRSKEIQVDLMEHLRRSPDARGATILAELHHALDQNAPMTTVVEKAVHAEELMRESRLSDPHAQRLKSEVMAKIRGIEERMDEALAAFERSAADIKVLVDAARELRDGYRTLIAEDDDLREEIEKLRYDINARITHGIETLRTTSPNDTNRIFRPPADI